MMRSTKGMSGLYRLSSSACWSGVSGGSAKKSSKPVGLPCDKILRRDLGQKADAMGTYEATLTLGFLTPLFLLFLLLGGR